MDYRHVRKSNFIYNLFHPMLHPEYRIVFRKIYFHRKNIVPANKPVLIAANHPSAFIDPIFFCIFFNPPVFNMTRGDIFRKPFFRKMLESMNMFPVFRHRDGYDQRDRNDEVFEFCRKKLKEGVAVNIFVEGEHHLDKRILTIQKGLARVAFGAYEKDRDDELQIFPIGCNYFFGDAERDEAKIIVGDPLFVKDYWELYQQNQAAAITKLCNDIRAALIRICYHIEDKNDDRLANQLLLLRRSDNPDTMLPIVHHHADRFFEEKAMLNGLNTLPAGEKEALRSNVEAYLAALKQSGLEDETFVQPQQGHFSWMIFFIMAAVPALAGYILSRPAHLLSSYVCKKAVKKREFYTSVLLGVRTLINFLIYVTFVLSGLISGMTWLIAMAFLMPILIWLFVFYRERLHHWHMARKAWSHPNREKIMLLRNAITLPAEAQ